MWDLIVSVPDHCLSFYHTLLKRRSHLMYAIVLSDTLFIEFWRMQRNTVTFLDILNNIFFKYNDNLFLIMEISPCS